MIIDTIPVGPIGTNCYLLGDEGKKVCALIDPGDEPRAVAAMVQSHGLTPIAIFLTHGHYDHRDGVAGLLEAYPGLPVYIHEKEQLQPGLPPRYFYDRPCSHYAEGDTLAVGDLTVTVLETPGHTAGSVTLLCGDAMFAGDTLFAGSCGRCDLPGGSMADMFASLKRLGQLEGDYRVLPGHGPSSTLETERRTNPYMRRAASL